MFHYITILGKREAGWGKGEGDLDEEVWQRRGADGGKGTYELIREKEGSVGVREAGG